MARRSILFAPGDQRELLYKATNTSADIVVFDLEDAVGPAETPAARTTVKSVFDDPSFDPDPEICVRVSRDPAADCEILSTAELSPELIMLPKAASATAVESLAETLTTNGLDCPIIALCETARGVLNASEIADAPPTTAIAFGGEDLAADLGATRTAAGTELQYARQRVVLAASAANVTAIDTVYTDFEDTAGLRAATSTARTLGYDGKMAIHPAQVEPINEAFTPEQSEIEWATTVVEAAKTHDGVFRVNDEMIDGPLIEQAKTILNRAEISDETS